MDNYGIKGVLGDFQSTVTGIIGIAATLGLLSAAQANGLTTVEQAVVVLIGAVLSCLKLFYKGD